MTTEQKTYLVSIIINSIEINKDLVLFADELENMAIVSQLVKVAEKQFEIIDLLISIGKYE